MRSSCVSRRREARTSVTQPPSWKNLRRPLHELSVHSGPSEFSAEKSHWSCLEDPVGVSEQDPQPDGSQDYQRDRRDNIWKMLPLHRQRISWPSSAVTKLVC